MQDQDEFIENKVKEILKTLDDALVEGPWDKTNFLRLIGKKLQNIRDKLAIHVTVANSEPETVAQQAIKQLTGQQEVFISLYSSEGMNMLTWERIVTNLPKQVVSRPVYVDEDNIKQLIKTKTNVLNEAYVSIYIDQEDILSLAPDKVPRDRLNNLLLSLKDSAIKLANINHFFHITGVYHYIDGRLVKIP